MIATCEGCKMGVDMPELPLPKIFNMPDCSMIVIEHGAKGHCPRCNADLAAAVRDINPSAIVIVAAPLVPVPEPSRIIKPTLVGARSN